MKTRVAAYLAELGSREGELFTATACTGENEGDDVSVVGVGRVLEVRQSGAVLLKTTDIAGELAEFIDKLCDGEAVILSAEWNASEVAFVMGQRCLFLDIDGVDWYQAQLIDEGYQIPYPLGDEARGLSRLARYDWARGVESGDVYLHETEDSLHLLRSGPAYVVAANDWGDDLMAENDLDAVSEFLDGYVTEAEGLSEEVWIRPDIASQLGAGGVGRRAHGQGRQRNVDTPAWIAQPGGAVRSIKTIAWVAHSDESWRKPGLLVQDVNTEDGAVYDRYLRVDDTLRRTGDPRSDEEERWDRAVSRAGFRRTGDWIGSGDGQAGAYVEEICTDDH